MSGLPSAEELTDFAIRLHGLNKDHGSSRAALSLAGGIPELVQILKQAAQDREIVEAIDYIRNRGEGDSITIFSDNPDGPPEVAVEIHQIWPSANLRIDSDKNLRDCLKQAKKYLEEADQL
jgi:hypothetical protein